MKDNRISFWTSQKGEEIRKLGREVQLLVLYLMSSPFANNIKIYYLPIKTVMNETGIPAKSIKTALKKLNKIAFCSYDFITEYVWVHQWNVTSLRN